MGMIEYLLSCFLFSLLILFNRDNTLLPLILKATRLSHTSVLKIVIGKDMLIFVDNNLNITSFKLSQKEFPNPSDEYIILSKNHTYRSIINLKCAVIPLSTYTRIKLFQHLAT